jgi:hypothetical protein
MLEDIEKYIRDVVGFKVENVLYVYFFKPRIIEKHRMDIRGHWKGPQRFIFKLMRNIKKNTWVLKILMF